MSKAKGTSFSTRALHFLRKFLLRPASPAPLAALRIGLSLLLIAHAWSLRGSLETLFSQSGLMQGNLSDYLSIPGTPRIHWVINAVSGFGITEMQVLEGFGLLYVIALIAMALGFMTTLSSIAVFFMHWTWMGSGYTTAYGVDAYAHVFLFYLMFMPSGDAWSLDVAMGRRRGGPSDVARISLRVLQLHLCISYFSSAILKGQGIQWWNGEVIWRSLNLPVYRQYDMTWLVNYPWISMVSAWGTLVLEGLYFIFIWPKTTRLLWVAAIAALHLGIAVFLGLTYFGLVMCVLTVSVFGLSSEPVRRRAGAPWWKRKELLQPAPI